MIVALYADGGVILKNPSPVGGPWAWCGVDENNKRVIARVGFISNHENGKPVTNNLTETIAILQAIEAMEQGWSGVIYSDSQIAVNRVMSWGENGVPYSMRGRLMAAKARLGRLRCVLVKGHPTRKELSVGRSSSGALVSEHNVWCDLACNAVKGVVLNHNEPSKIHHDVSGIVGGVVVQSEDWCGTLGAVQHQSGVSDGNLRADLSVSP